MKVKKVESIVKSERHITVAQGNYEQWMLCSGAAYPLRGMPMMIELHFYRMYDIPPDKCDKYHYTEQLLPEEYSFEDVARAEGPVGRGDIKLLYGGRTLEPLSVSQGVVFIDTRYLSPFGDEDNYELYERIDKNGQSYIAVKQGFELIGLPFPFDVVEEHFIKAVEAVLRLTKIAYSNKQAAESSGQIAIE